MLVLLMKVIYEVHRWDCVRWNDIMKIGWGIQIKLRLLPQQFLKLQCWYYRWDGFMKYVIETSWGGLRWYDIHMTFHDEGSGIQVALRALPQQTETVALVLLA
jgi:hypothetical protein